MRSSMRSSMRTNMKSRASQKGFTLIELVVVIVILGILAVTAAPKFIDVQEDARTATLNAVKASMQSVATMVYSKSLIAGTETDATENVYVNGTEEPTAYGYPRSNDDDAVASWGRFLDVNSTDFTIARVGTTVVIHPASKAAPSSISDTIGADNNCYAYYTEQLADAVGPPVVVAADHKISVVNCI